MTARTVDTTPKPGFLRAMQAQKWTVSGAIAELVDNGFGLGRGAADRVHITYDTGKKILSVFDNGRGMDSLGRLFQLGNTVGVTPGDIGRFGSGGTMAILWLAKKVEVWTVRDGKVAHDAVDWNKCITQDAFPRISDEWRRCSIANTPEDLLSAGHGTLIRLHLGKARRFHTSNVQRDLAETYASAIRQRRELWWTTIGKNGTTQQLGDLLMEPTGADTVRFDLVVEIDGKHLPAQGVVGIIEGLSQQRSHIAFSYGGRIITRTRDCYTSPDGAKKYSGSGVAGWVDLSEAWRDYLAVYKDEVNDQRAWDALLQEIARRIEPLLKKVESRNVEVVFEELALNLQHALEGKAKVRVASVPEDAGTGETSTPGGSKPADPDPHDPAEIEPTDDPDAPDHEGTPQAASVLVVQQTDRQMEGILCRAELRSGDGIYVYVNEDHYAVQEALKAKPTNRLMLNVFISREIAQEIVAQREIAQALLPAWAWRVIEDKEQDHAAREVHRFLMDNLRRESAA